VYPLEPRSGATVGTRPRLRIGVDGADVLKMRFRIEMSRDGFDTVAYRFDQAEEPGGWAFVATGFDEPGALYMVRSPLEDGAYEWRTYAWNGVEWVEGRTVNRLIVDGVPPADVEGVRMHFDPRRPAIVLEWDPVVTDRSGHPETVARYHVYRYYRRSFFFVIRAFHVAAVEGTYFEDTDPLALTSGLVFYKITAEDEAGNEAERRY
jgi:hypothetical protein